MTQQKETLNEFVNRRMSELGLGYKDVQNAGIGAQTQVNIRQGKVAGLQEVTKQKLALLLKCSQGEINAAIANTVQVTKTGEYVIRQSAEPSVMKTVDKLEQIVEEEYPELASSADNVHVSEKDAQIAEENDQEPIENVQDHEENAQETEKPKTEQPKRKTKKNKSYRYNRAESPDHQICDGRSEGYHGGRVPAAVEGYVPAAAVRGRSVRRGLDSIVCSYWPKTA